MPPAKRFRMMLHYVKIKFETIELILPVMQIASKPFTRRVSLRVFYLISLVITL